MSFETFDPDQWHPIRLPETGSGARAGRRLNQMESWCGKHCAQAWLQVRNSSGRPVFWFESDSDAMNFSLTWFPVKAL